MRITQFALIAALLLPLPAMADQVPLSGNTYPVQKPPGGNVPMVADGQSAPFQGVTQVTLDQSYTAGRALQANCTSTGNITYVLVDGTTGVWIVGAAGTYVIPDAVTKVTTSGTTATCTFYIKK